MELVQLTEKTFYIDAPTRIGIYRLDDTQVCLVDSGNDADTGRRIKKIMNEKGWTVASIYHTHGHPDHFGGTAYLQRAYACPAYASAGEDEFLRHPAILSHLLWGAKVPPALRNKMVMASDCAVTTLTPADLPEGWEIIELPGHTPYQVGYRTDDGVVFLGDSIVGKNQVERYKLTALIDVETYLETLEKIQTMTAKVFVPSHTAPFEDPEEPAQYNVDVIHEIGNSVVEYCREPIIYEDILARVFTDAGRQINELQYTLLGGTLHGYLTWLVEQERMRYEFRDNHMYWIAV